MREPQKAATCLRRSPFREQHLRGEERELKLKYLGSQGSEGDLIVMTKITGFNRLYLGSIISVGAETRVHLSGVH